jgi:hypothetical protein
MKIAERAATWRRERRVLLRVSRALRLVRVGSGVESVHRSSACAPPKRFVHADRGFTGQGSLARANPGTWFGLIPSGLRSVGSSAADGNL